MNLKNWVKTIIFNYLQFLRELNLSTIKFNVRFNLAIIVIVCYNNFIILGIRVVLDFVPNHSSNESVWFELSANRTKGYENYFVWADGKPDPNNPGKTIPPSNWVS